MEIWIFVIFMLAAGDGGLDSTAYAHPTQADCLVHRGNIVAVNKPNDRTYITECFKMVGK